MNSLLDDLQSDMEAIALGERQNRGRFCGFCFAELGEANRRKPSLLPAAECAVCGTSTDRIPPVDQVPSIVLDIYMAKRRREGLIVNCFAFVGIFLSLVLSAIAWFLLPENLWRVVPFLILAFGSYYLARLLGYDAGVPIGARAGRTLRDRRWGEFQRERQLGT